MTTRQAPARRGAATRTVGSKAGLAGGPTRRRCGPSALILAAGESRRFLGTKQLAVIGGKTLVERALDVVPQDKVRETVVVLGHDAESVAASMRARRGVRVLENADYRAGMATSIRAGILSLAGDTEGVMLLLADQPLVTRSLLLRMLKAFGAEGAKGKIVAAAHADLVTPPVIFSKRYFRELSGLRGDSGARSVIQGHPGSLLLVRVRSAKVLADIDTREELEAARRLLEP